LPWGRDLAPLRRSLATRISTHTGELSGPAYVHTKIGIVGDAWLTLG
jgi:hypothetical protein